MTLRMHVDLLYIPVESIESSTYLNRQDRIQMLSISGKKHNKSPENFPLPLDFQ